MANKTKNNRQQMTETRNSLSLETRQQIIELLNQHLADTFDLYSQTKFAHWNVKGRDFFQLHKLFDELADIVEGYVDMIAERVTALGGIALGTTRMAAANSRLQEYPEAIMDSMQHVTCLADRFGQYANSSREAIDTSGEAGDQATADLFTEIVRDVDKALYFLEAHLQAHSGQED
jgi:starvation-inducible DNA-binding protein